MTAFPRLFKIPKHSNNYVISFTAYHRIPVSLKLNIYPVPLFKKPKHSNNYVIPFTAYHPKITVSEMDGYSII
jgi:hypothetical protein